MFTYTARKFANIPDMSTEWIEKYGKHFLSQIDKGQCLLCDSSEEIFKNGFCQRGGYDFSFNLPKFLCKVVTDVSNEYFIRYAKDKETCERILEEYYTELEYDFFEIRVIENPFTI